MDAINDDRTVRIFSFENISRMKRLTPAINHLEDGLAKNRNGHIII